MRKFLVICALKSDFREVRRELYEPSGTNFSVVDVPELLLARIDEHADANASPDYARAVEALYSVSYAASSRARRSSTGTTSSDRSRGCGMPSVEAFIDRSKAEWLWTVIIRQPEWITAELFERAVAKAVKKQPAAEAVRLEAYAEGLSVQILHVGSYDDEGPTIARMHQEFLPANGYVENGRHHEIYLSDPRRVEAARLKTVLRQPVRRV